MERGRDEEREGKRENYRKEGKMRRRERVKGEEIKEERDIYIH